MNLAALSQAIVSMHVQGFAKKNYCSLPTYHWAIILLRYIDVTEIVHFSQIY